MLKGERRESKKSKWRKFDLFDFAHKSLNSPPTL